MIPFALLDSTQRLLTAVSSKQASEVEKMKSALQRLRFEEQARSQRRRASAAVSAAATGGLPAWREVVSPHPDVASGHYQQAEFAADLWQVHLGEGSTEYRNPTEFFGRTYLTQSLRGLLANGLQRLSGQGGEPVVQLQTNFGGGKTHSMLALYHLFSGAQPGELDGIDDIMQAAGVTDLPRVNPRRPRRQPHLARQSRSPSRTARRCARCGASLPGSWAMAPAARPRRALPLNGCAPTTSAPPIPATCCDSC